MLFELSEIQKQQALVDNLQQSRKNIQDRLIQSYSANQKNNESLREKFSSIINESALLIHILREIEQSVQYKSLLPTILHQKDISKLLYSTTTLPEWFDHVFSKEYEKEKINLETIANKMYKLHGLAEKNSQLVKGHWNMEILLKRYDSLSQKDLESLDIIQEVQNFQYLHKSCKEIFKNFLDMITKKVLEFLENTVQSTMLYSNQLKKVKSFDDRGFRQFSILNDTAGIQSPRSIHHQVPNVDSRNTVKVGSPYQPRQMASQYLENQKGLTDQTIKNNSTVESLRQREKANNEYFFRQAQQKDRLNQNSLTKEIIKSARSQNGDIYKIYAHSPSQNYLKPRQESRDSSIGSVRSFYDESIALKKYKSTTNLNYGPETSLSRKYPLHEDSRQTVRIQQIRANKSTVRGTSNSKSHKCLHHCPHHDKSLNNHCSKHCNNLCSHEKMLFNDFGVDLPQMNRQYYENRDKNNNKTINSARSIDYHSPRGQNVSRQRDSHNVYTRRQRNLAQNTPYLRNSHEKHSDYYQSRKSPVHKKNIRFSGNRPLNKVENQQSQMNQRTQRSVQKKVQFQPYQNSNRLRSPPPVHASQYYYS